MDPIPVLEYERILRSTGWQGVFDMDETIQTQIARLSSDVQHIQTDVADIKVGLRRVEDRLDAVNGRIDSVHGNIYRLEEKLTDKMEAIRNEQADKTESVRSSLTEKIDALRSEIASIKVWALGLYFALAGSLLFVMAKGFKGL
jgi:chromosome segregation ATPase